MKQLLRITFAHLSFVLLLISSLNIQWSTAQNLVTNGNFAQAHACPASGFTSDYTCDPTPNINGNGYFAITTNSYNWNGPWYGTSRTADGTNFLIADGGAAPNTRVWIQSVNVVNGQLYTFSAYVKNIANPASVGTESPVETVSLRVNGSSIVTSAGLTQTATNAWTLVSGTYTATSTGSVTLDIFQNVIGIYNDVAIDDINFSAGSSTGIFDGNSEAKWDIQAVPNPFGEETTISVPSTDPSEIRAEIYTTSGILLSTHYFQPTEKFTLGKELNTGMYFIKLNQNNVSQTVKVLKQ